MGPKITVVGSWVVGLTLRAERFPVKGETLVGRDFDQGPGGKGSNQAVQAARLGANVEFVGLIGQDDFGRMALDLYREERVGTTFLGQVAEKNTGVGFIVLNRAGENFIIIDPGTNNLLNRAWVRRAGDRIRQSGAVITQLEIPAEAAAEALLIARQAGVLTVLNPAPARPLPLEWLGLADVVTPNETELRILLGLAPDDPTDALELCRRLLVAGVRTVVVTLGEQGALVVDESGSYRVPAFPVEVVDTTGAGDSFSATLTVGLAAGLPLRSAVQRACAAGALTCTRLGVVPGLPRQTELEQFLAKQAAPDAGNQPTRPEQTEG